MVDTAIFSIFHRAAPAPTPAPVAPDVEARSPELEQAAAPAAAADSVPDVPTGSHPAEPTLEEVVAASAPEPPAEADARLLYEPQAALPDLASIAHDAPQPETVPPPAPAIPPADHAGTPDELGPAARAGAHTGLASGSAIEPEAHEETDLPVQHSGAEPATPVPEDAWPAALGHPQPEWRGPAGLTNIAVPADQLGIANPTVITLLARLGEAPAIELDASGTGIYRPPGVRAAPWSSSAYDQAQNGRTGIAAGTRILTSRGEMEVEALQPGDTALALRTPALLPIAWIGRSSATAAPILIEAGALGPDLPRRPVCLAPDQPVYLRPVPVPAGQLVNGTTIRPIGTTAIDLFHVDVGKAEILFAEGLPLSSSDRASVQAAH